MAILLLLGNWIMSRVGAKKEKMKTTLQCSHRYTYMPWSGTQCIFSNGAVEEGKQGKQNVRDRRRDQQEEQGVSGERRE